MRANSLALRLFLWATGWTVVILIITGIALSTLYRHAVERAFDRRLDVYLRTLVADVASPEEGADKYPQSIGEPLFELPLSGWYWQVTRLDTKTPEVHSSRSLWDSSLPRLPDEKSAADTEYRQGYAKGPEDQELRLVERDIDLGDDGRYLIAVAGDASEIDDETRSFDRAISITFTALTLALLLTTALQVRFGLAPLARISESLAAIRSGRAERLEGEFPVEIAPLARETNALDRRQSRNRRARAHPCRQSGACVEDAAVGHRQRGGGARRRSARSQGSGADRHHARSGRASARARAACRALRPSSARSTEVPPVVTALARTMEKLYRDARHRHRRRRARTRAVSRRAAGPRGDDRQSRRQRLQMGAVARRHRGGGRSRRCRLPTSDQAAACASSSTTTAPGLSPAEREQVALRGQRLDETKPGSGLGLSIVVELAGLYGGVLTLGTAPIGGLRAELALPGG